VRVLRDDRTIRKNVVVDIWKWGKQDGPGKGLVRVSRGVQHLLPESRIIWISGDFAIILFTRS